MLDFMYLGEWEAVAWKKEGQREENVCLSGFSYQRCVCVHAVDIKSFDVGTGSKAAFQIIWHKPKLHTDTQKALGASRGWRKKNNSQNFCAVLLGTRKYMNQIKNNHFLGTRN